MFFDCKDNTFLQTGKKNFHRFARCAFFSYLHLHLLPALNGIACDASKVSAWGWSKLSYFNLHLNMSKNSWKNLSP